MVKEVDLNLLVEDMDANLYRQIKDTGMGLEKFDEEVNALIDFFAARDLSYAEISIVVSALMSTFYKISAKKPENQDEH